MVRAQHAAPSRSARCRSIRAKQLPANRQQLQAIVLRINAEHPLGPVTASTVGALIARYEKEEMPARYSTRVSYQSFIDRYIRPRWAETPITGVKPMAVEDWLKQLKLAPKTRGHIRALMSLIVQMCAALGIGPEQPDAVGTGKGRQQATGTAIRAYSGASFTSCCRTSGNPTGPWF